MTDLPFTGIKCVQADPVDPDDEVYDSPHGSKWIVAISENGDVAIIRNANVHYGFFDCGGSPEDIGLPDHAPDTPPGVYEWTCSFQVHTDWESGIPDDHEFSVEEEKLLWLLPKEEERVNMKCPKCGTIAKQHDPEEFGEDVWYCPNKGCPQTEIKREVKDER